MDNTELNKKKVKLMLRDLESEKIERTTSVNDTDKFARTICAFSNDLYNSGKNGYLLIGVDDNGTLAGLKAIDRQLQSLGSLRSDGNILPQPIMSVSTFSFKAGDVIAIEVQPSPFPPVRYKGKTWIRVGPRKAVANEMEERILIEKRTTNVSTFDVRPSIGNGLNNINQKIFTDTYLPLAIDKEVLENDRRELPEKLASLRFYSPNYQAITNAGLLVFGNEVEMHFSGAYIQYVKFNGLLVSDEPVNEKKFSGNLIYLLSELEAFLEYAIIQQKPIPVSTLKERKAYNFPKWAIRELLMNAIMHRDYESNTPVKFYQFSNRIEIVNPGGLYGNARPENFPFVNDYRNPVVAEAMKVLGYVNRFNRGIARVQVELKENGNPDPIFDYKNLGVFGVTVFEAPEREITKTQITSEKTSEKIIKLIRENNKITIPEMADRINISKKGIEYHIQKLQVNKQLTRIGAKRGGEWKIL
jgi:ATP-dependent DNA helicase RecG